MSWRPLAPEEKHLQCDELAPAHSRGEALRLLWKFTGRWRCASILVGRKAHRQCSELASEERKCLLSLRLASRTSRSAKTLSVHTGVAAKLLAQYQHSCAAAFSTDEEVQGEISLAPPSPARLPVRKGRRTVFPKGPPAPKGALRLPSIHQEKSTVGHPCTPPPSVWQPWEEKPQASSNGLRNAV
ncbi:hypothetical protein CYMTET_14400 [Cymbomonas tetramitiformis]|uniref:Uncharacterized protein n=1 Tax=Cymbomonas tetramitiformis TaxID=36881 RepID=A0AAE0GG60_9CHLO|nr:hypothetical protein CYMTET_14400 [Cymbomonas tetramitiformis]